MKNRTSLTATVISLLSMFMLPLTAGAASFEVTNLNDSGAGSLRQAIIDADAAPGPDEVNFQQDLSGVIELLSELLIGNDAAMTINGPGTEVITLDAGQRDRVFNIGPDAPVQISGLTITGGNPDPGNNSSHGGAILTNSDLTLRNVVVTGNVSSVGNGGGIFVIDGDVLIEDTSITNNQAPDGNGGGVFSRDNQITFNRSLISGNTASGDGGGISTQDALLSVLSSTVSGNTAGPSGGGIFVRRGDLSIIGGAITGNSAIDTLPSGNGGGAINLQEAPAYIANVLISGNLAQSTQNQVGGAILAAGKSDRSTELRIYNTTIENNESVGAEGQAGGVFLLDVDAEILATTISNNKVTGANGKGAGITFYTSNVRLYNSTLSGNLAEGTSASVGGIWSWRESGETAPDNVLWLYNTTLANNGSVSNPRAIQADAGTDFRLYNSIVSGSQSSATACNTVATTVVASLATDTSCTGAATFVQFLALGPLTAAGGSTMTHPLAEGSVAIDAGDATICQNLPVPPGIFLPPLGHPGFDQRGAVRDAMCDIGAFEYGATPGCGRTPAQGCSVAARGRILIKDDNKIKVALKRADFSSQQVNAGDFAQLCVYVDDVLQHKATIDDVDPAYQEVTDKLVKAKRSDEYRKLKLVGKDVAGKAKAKAITSNRVNITDSAFENPQALTATIGNVNGCIRGDFTRKLKSIPEKGLLKAKIPK